MCINLTAKGGRNRGYAVTVIEDIVVTQFKKMWRKQKSKYDSGSCCLGLKNRCFLNFLYLTFCHLGNGIWDFGWDLREKNTLLYRKLVNI